MRSAFLFGAAAAVMLSAFDFGAAVAVMRSAFDLPESRSLQAWQRQAAIDERDSHFEGSRSCPEEGRDVQANAAIASRGCYLQARQRQAAIDERDRRINDASLSPEEKRAVQTRHILTWGKALFSCPRCWLQPHFCICDRMTQPPAAADVLVVAHLHHNEWCAASWHPDALMPLLDCWHL